MKPTRTAALSLGLAASAALAFTASAHAAEDSAPAPATPPHHPADLNRDGNITAEEFDQFHKDLFAGADANTDGLLDQNEMRALASSLPAPHGRKGRRGEMRSVGKEGRDRTRPNPEEFFATLDANQDGKLDNNEVPERMAEHFDRLDADSDGGVTIEEFKQGRPDRKEMRQRFEERFWNMDTNEDGMIQKSEATGRLVDKFESMDSNGDGAIDKQELESARSKFQRRGHGAEGDHPRRHRSSGEPGAEPDPS